MLTPGVRSGLRYGLPLVAVLAGLGGYFADQARRDAVVARTFRAGGAARRPAGPGFEGRPALRRSYSGGDSPAETATSSISPSDV